MIEQVVEIVFLYNHEHVGHFEEVRATTNLLPYTRKKFFKGIQPKILHINLKINKLPFWVLTLFGFI